MFKLIILFTFIILVKSDPVYADTKVKLFKSCNGTCSSIIVDTIICQQLNDPCGKATEYYYRIYSYYDFNVYHDNKCIHPIKNDLFNILCYDDDDCPENNVYYIKNCSTIRIVVIIVAIAIAITILLLLIVLIYDCIKKYRQNKAKYTQINTDDNI